jgi:ABC-type nitrate/sulfonate/bicarbonate transport system substrate-binding protein
MRKSICVLLAASLCLGYGPDGSVSVAAAAQDPVEELLAGYEFQPLPENEQKREVNMGYYNCDHMTAACVGMDSGIFEKMGLRVKTTGNGRVPEAMSAGRMDVAYAGWTTTLGAVQHGTPLFIAAENHTGGAEYLVVSHKIKTPQDLIGKKIAVGSDPANTMNWVEWTKELGIPSEIEHYQNFNMSDADEYFAFAAGELDAFICCDPWGSMAEYEKTGWIMVRQDTDRPTGHGTCCKVAMNYDFAKKFPELASRLLLAHTFCIEYMYLHPYKAAEIFAENYNVPLEVGLMTLYKKLNEEGRTIRWDLNRQYMQNQLDTMKALNVRDDINSVNLDEYVDMSYFDKSGAPDFAAFIQEKVDPLFPLGMSYENWRAKAVETDGIVEEEN